MNRYIGNTGRFVRVEDQPPLPRTGGMTRPIHYSPPASSPPPEKEGPPPKAAPPPRLGGGWPNDNISHIGRTYSSPKSATLPFSGPLRNLTGGLRGLGGGSSALRDLFRHLPFGLDAGDILLLLLLLFFYIESGDEEFLIILAFLVFSLIKDAK